jgi:uncharacterized membrane protein
MKNKKSVFSFKMVIAIILAVGLLIVAYMLFIDKNPIEGENPDPSWACRSIFLSS